MPAPIKSKVCGAVAGASVTPPAFVVPIWCQGRGDACPTVHLRSVSPFSFGAAIRASGRFTLNPFLLSLPRLAEGHDEAILKPPCHSLIRDLGGEHRADRHLNSGFSGGSVAQVAADRRRRWLLSARGATQRTRSRLAKRRRGAVIRHERDARIEASLAAASRWEAYSSLRALGSPRAAYAATAAS